MKTSIIVIALLVSGILSIQADQFQVVERGADYRVLQKTAYEGGTNRVHRYTAVSTGMHFWNNGQWTESKEEITILPQGGAVANQARHSVAFPSDIGSGILKIITPGGQVLQSRPLCVTLDDGRNAVVIGVLTNASGWLTASNQVTYKNCFTGIKADLVCDFKRGGFACSLVFRSRPPAPSTYGLLDDSSTIQLVTEFFNTQDPQQIPAASDDWFGLQDDTLKFGKMTMGQGKAFAVKSPNSQLPSASSQTPVYKSWLHLQGRTFLVEQVPLVYLADELDVLPLAAKAEGGSRKAEVGNLASAIQSLPVHAMAADNTNQIQIASADLNRQPGVVLDYNVVDSDQSDITFYAGETYFISDWVYIGGTATIQGGTVIKFLKDGCYGLTCSNVVCATDPYNPAIFTSQNDNSVGDWVDGSSGSPATGGNCYLDCLNSFELAHCRFSYAGTAVAVGDSVVNDCQFVQCGYGIVGGNITVHNVLASGCQWVFDASATCDNCTFDSCAGICDWNGEFTNCVFLSVGSIGYTWYSPPPDPPLYVYVGSNNTFDNPDQAFGDNVVTGSIVDAGNVSADKLGLYWWTTQGPNTMEGTTIVDLGYHTPAVDAYGNPVSTLVSGVPDYISDPNGDGVPDSGQGNGNGNGNGPDNPVVGVYASSDAAIRPNPVVAPTPSYFQVKSSANVTSNLVVYFTTSGTASNGVDYILRDQTGESLTNSVTIQTGNRAADIELDPMMNPLCTSNVMATITLNTNSSYMVNSNAPAASITIEPSITVASIYSGNDAVRPSPGFAATPSSFEIASTVIDTNYVVYFTISGTASNGVDYVLRDGNTGALITNLVTIYADKNGGAGEIEVDPTTNLLCISNLTVIITLVTNADDIYKVNSNWPSGTINIEANVFSLVAANLSAPCGIDYSPFTNALIVSTKNTPLFAPGIWSFLRIDTNGVVSRWSGVQFYGTNDEVELAAVKTTANGYTNGEMFFDSSDGGTIGRLSPDGTVSNMNFVNVSGPRFSGLYVDQGGSFGTNLIAGQEYDRFGNGGVWLISSNGVANHIVAAGEIEQDPQGIISLTNNGTNYGPWAGKIVTGLQCQCEGSAPPEFYTISTNYAVSNYLSSYYPNLNIYVEDCDLIVTNQNLYVEDDVDGWILKVSSGIFANHVGDVLITEDGVDLGYPAALFIVHWNPATQSFVTTQISSPYANNSFEQSTFAPIDIPPVSP